jgi:hypothetical protein
VSEVTQDASVPITVDEGNNVGAVVIPNQQQQTGSGILVISSAIVPNNTDLSLVLSPIVELTLFDENGNEISLLDNSIQVCLEVESTDENLCLSYLDTSVSPPEWKCQDACLSRQNSTYVCGQTGHFTSFAVLLSGNSDNGCGGGSSGVDVIIQWLSFAALIAAGGVICFTVMIMELWRRRQLAQKHRGAQSRAATRRKKYLQSLKSETVTGLESMESSMN